MVEARGIRSKNGSTAEFATVTPEMARKWLEASAGKNIRPIQKNRLSAMLEEIGHDGWVMDGSPLRFLNGILIDGQHRLEAIARLGLTVECLIVRLNDDIALMTIDGGQSRTGGQVVGAVCGVKNENSIAAAARKIMQFEAGKYKSQMTVFCTSRQVANFVNANPEIEEIDRASRRTDLIRLIFASETAWMLWATQKHGLREKFESFLEKVATGANIRTDDPAYQLRLRLQINREKKAKLTAYHLRALVITAWNKWKNNEPCRQLKALVGDGADQFPDMDLNP